MGNTRIVNTPSQAIPQRDTLHTTHSITNAAVVDFADIFPSGVNSLTTHVLVQFYGGVVNATFDGATDPTATATGTGFRYLDNTSAYLRIDMLQKARFIAQTDTVTIAVQELNYK